MSTVRRGGSLAGGRKPLFESGGVRAVVEEAGEPSASLPFSTSEKTRSVAVVIDDDPVESILGRFEGGRAKEPTKSLVIPGGAACWRKEKLVPPGVRIAGDDIALFLPPMRVEEESKSNSLLSFSFFSSPPASIPAAIECRLLPVPLLKLNSNGFGSPVEAWAPPIPGV